MAAPNIKVSLVPINNLIIKNDEGVACVYSIYKLKDDGSNFETYDVNVVHTLSIAEEKTIILSEDNLYRIDYNRTSGDMTVTGIYILADQNVKLCHKSLIKSILCAPVKDCNTKAYYKLLEKRQRFYVLQNAIYAIYGKYIDGFNAENLSYGDIAVVQANYRLYLNSLKDICGCLNITPDNCISGELPTTNWTNLSSSDCGCN
jgi:hypothetical protein